MPGSTFTPFVVSDHKSEDAATLQARFAQSGYLFFRDLIDRARIEGVRDRVIGALKAHGFVQEEAISQPTCRTTTFSGRSSSAQSGYR